MRRWVIGVLGIWREEGLGKGLGQGRSVYKQPETEVDGSWILSQLGGFQVSRKGNKGESARGEKSKGMRHVYCNLCSCI